MSNNAWATHITPVAAIVIGVLICFGGYRILKLSLGLLGFAAGALAGWHLGLALAPDNTVIALALGVVLGVAGALLCLWVYFIGIFVLGASAGAVIAAALFTGAGQESQPLLLLVFTVVFGVVALLAQKFMVVLSTAVSGAYLITAGILPLVVEGQNKFPMWFNPAQAGASGTVGYATLALWLVLALLGAGFQFRGRRKKVEVEKHS